MRGHTEASILAAAFNFFPSFFNFFRLGIKIEASQNPRARCRGDFPCFTFHSHSIQMSYIVSTDASKWFSDDGQKETKARGTELRNFLQVVAHNDVRFHALCKYYAVDGAGLDPGCCAPVGKALMQRVLADAYQIILSNVPVDGEEGHWNNGCFGSRWLDMKASDYGVNYIRLAFYSKKGNPKWRHAQPYAIVATIEKAK